MGLEERQCAYCECVATNSSIIICDVCDRYVCKNEDGPDCDFMTVPEYKVKDDIWMCGFCQLKENLSKEQLNEFIQKENMLRKQIKELHKTLKDHYKQLENML